MEAVNISKEIEEKMNIKEVYYFQNPKSGEIFLLTKRNDVAYSMECRGILTLPKELVRGIVTDLNKLLKGENEDGSGKDCSCCNKN